MRAFAAAEPLMLRNPLAVRPWQHVLEPVRGLLMLAERLADDGARFAGAWNLGPAGSDMWPVERVVAHLIAPVGPRRPLRARQTARSPTRRACSPSTAPRPRPGSAGMPVWRVADALERAVEWYRAFHDGADMRALTLDQIDRYAGVGAPARTLPTRRAGGVGTKTGGY